MIRWPLSWGRELRGAPPTLGALHLSGPDLNRDLAPGGTNDDAGSRATR